MLKDFRKYIYKDQNKISINVVNRVQGKRLSVCSMTSSVYILCNAILDDIVTSSECLI